MTEVKARLRSARVSSQKARLVSNQIRGKQVEDKDKELEEMRMTLEPYTKLGLTPDKILELSKKRPVDLKVPAFSGLKPKTPGKLQEPLLSPSPVKPEKPTPTTKPKSQP